LHNSDQYPAVPTNSTASCIMSAALVLGARRAVEVQRVVDLEEQQRLAVAGGGCERAERPVDEVLDGEHDVAGGRLHGEVADFGDHALATTGEDLA
jgi:hypothetical protein